MLGIILVTSGMENVKRQVLGYDEMLYNRSVLSNSPQMLNKLLPLFDDIECGIQSAALLLLKQSYQLLNSIHRLGVQHRLHKSLLKVLHP